MKNGDKYMFFGFIFQREFDASSPESREKYNAGSGYRDVNAEIKYLDEDQE
jgi:hypothetical protein